MQRKRAVCRRPSGIAPIARTASNTAVRSEAPASAGKQACESSRAAAKSSRRGQNSAQEQSIDRSHGKQPPLCGPLSPLPRRTASLGAKRARDAVREESRRNHMPPRRQAKRRACLCPSGFRAPPRMRHNANTPPLPISRRAKAPALPQKTARANKGTRRENGLTAAAKPPLALRSPTVPLLPRRTAARSAKQAQDASRTGIRRNRVPLHIRRREANVPLPPENRRTKTSALP